MPYVPFPTSDTENSFTIRGPFQLPDTWQEQKLAEIAAREANPRSGIPDDQFDQLTLERALAEQLSPFNVGVALGINSVTEPRYGRNTQYLGLGNQGYMKAGSTVLKRNPLTGQLDVAFEPKPKGPSVLDKAKLSDIQAQLKSEYTAYAKATDEDERDFHAQMITDLRNAMDSFAEEAAHTPQQNWMVDPNTIPSGAPKNVQYPKSQAEADALAEFALPGQRTPFSFIGGNEPFTFSGGKRLTLEQARAFRNQAGGDLVKARALARAAGYSF